MPITRAQKNGTETELPVSEPVSELPVSEPVSELPVSELPVSELPASELPASELPVFEALSPPPSDHATEIRNLFKFSNLKKMTVKDTKPQWKTIKHVKTTKRLDKYMFMKDEAFRQNNKANCQVCRTGGHEMRAKYTDMCSCGYAYCMR